MIRLSLVRYDKSGNGVCGQLYDGQDLICSTLELPDLQNQSDKSCIPCEIYQVKMTFSSKFGRMMFQVLNVHNRTGIRIHPANHIEELLGCIAVGREIAKDYEYNGKVYPLWLKSSRKTLKMLEEKYEEGFELEIKELLTNDQKLQTC